jgi:hypothetical protein
MNFIQCFEESGKLNADIAGISLWIITLEYAYEIQVEVFWVVKLCSDAVGYQRFRGHCSLCITTGRHNLNITTSNFITMKTVNLACTSYADKYEKAIRQELHFHYRRIPHTCIIILHYEAETKENQRRGLLKYRRPVLGSKKVKLIFEVISQRQVLQRGGWARD